MNLQAKFERLKCSIRASCLGALCLVTLAGEVLANEPELLPPEEAFAMSATVDNARALISWRVAPGYFMYRDKFRFALNGESIAAELASIPPGEHKLDELFGEVQILRDEFTVELPLPGISSAMVELTTISQGCADIGVCYPPQTVKTSLNMASAESQPATQMLAQLSTLLSGDATDEFLPPDLAFVMSHGVDDEGRLVVEWDIADGYYLYREKILAQVIEPAGAALLAIETLPGTQRTDEYFGDVEVYYGAARARLIVDRATMAADDVAIELSYQGCADAGLCYPPQKHRLNFSLPSLGALLVRTAAAGTAVPGDAKGELSQQDRIAQSLIGDNLAWSLLAFFGFGLLLTFTPCVLPMIPILSSIIVGQGESLATGRAFLLSLAYVLAMALTYALVGVAAGLLGSGLQAMFQNPWVIVAFSLLFVVLAGAMFGFYELALPAALQTRLSSVSNKQAAGTYVGAAVMGVLSALIVGPCVAAPLAGALIYIGQTGDALLGGAALFTLSLGMGVPLLVVGTTAGRLLPRVGAWMDSIKALFGFVLLGVGLFLLERIVPAWLPMIGWAAILVAMAVYYGAFASLPTHASKWRQALKATTYAALLYAGLLIVGVAAGGTDPLRPLQALGGADAHHALEFKRVATSAELSTEIEVASRNGRSVMLDYYADWCISCKEMEKYTFTDSRVRAALADVTLLQVDVTKNSDDDQALLERFGLYGPPAILFFGADGEERSRFRLVGFIAPAVFAEHVKNATF